MKTKIFNSDGFWHVMIKRHSTKGTWISWKVDRSLIKAFNRAHRETHK